MRRGVLSDFNDDQSLDLIMAGREAGVLEIHANNGIGRLGLGDRVAPDLVLLGETAMSIPAGGEYVEPGATAVDDIDGDITDQIVVISNVNPAVVGKYSVTYTVTDRASNQASRVRTVNVGVNEGTGGSGGGAMSLVFILALGLIFLGESLRNPLIWWVKIRTEGVSSWGIPAKQH